jgi:plastocyanin
MKKIVSQLSAAMLVGALVFTTSCKKPEATVTASKSADIAIGEPIKFSSSEELLKNTYITYDFGDGSQIVGLISPSHAYDAAGTYTVSVEFLRTKDARKQKGKRTWGTADVTVVAVTPTFDVKDASDAATTAVKVGQEVRFVNTTVVSTATQSPISYTWWANGVSAGSGKNMSWTPTASGKYVVKLAATQGSTTVYSAEQTVTVAGQDLTRTEMQAMIGGKWNCTSSANYSGYGGTCAVAPTYSNPYSSFYLDNSGSSTWSISAYTSTNGNLTSGGPDITVVNSTTVSVTGAGFIGGLYTCTVSGGGMTLTMVDKSIGSPCSYTDTYTITLTR